MTDRSSRPGRPRHQTPAHLIALIRQLRVTHGLPAWALGRALGVPRSTVSAWLRRLGLNRPPTEPAAPVQRYEWPTAGDMIHVDIKPLGPLPPGRASRAWGPPALLPRRGLGVRRTSRSTITRAWPTSRSCRISAAPPARAFLERAIAWYRARGITCERVLSDNGSGYRSRVFREACAALALRHRRTRPYTPRTNGKAERFIQTLLREWAYVEPYATSQERRRALRPWVRYYNRERPHASLGYQPPLTRLQRAA